MSRGIYAQDAHHHSNFWSFNSSHALKSEASLHNESGVEAQSHGVDTRCYPAELSFMCAVRESYENGMSHPRRVSILIYTSKLIIE